MADPLTGMSLIFSGFIGTILKWLLGIVILGLVGWAIIITFFKPKEIPNDYIQFKKNFDATAIGCKLKSPKTLVILSYPQKIDDLQKMPEYQLHHQPIGTVVGINASKITHNIKTILELGKEFKKETWEKFKEENKDLIDNDMFWIMLAVKRKVGSKFFGIFPTIQSTLVMIKTNQIIDLNSVDGLIRVRGFGIKPIGYYELIVDENTNLNHHQLTKDLETDMVTEMDISVIGKLPKIIDHAIGLDSDHKKGIHEKGLEIASKPTSPEGKI